MLIFQKNFPKKGSFMTIHIGANVDEVAETVLLPGDPIRAKVMAEEYLSDVVCYNKVRGMLGFTGHYKGQRVSIQGTGMGCPSISIYAQELIKDYNVKNLVRVGSCGAIQKNVDLKDIILAASASSDSGINNQLFQGRTFAPTASFDLLFKVKQQADEMNKNIHVGNILTTDLFYDETEFWKTWFKYGVLAIDMESSALYTLCARFGVKSLSILTVSDHLLTQEKVTSEERQNDFHQMIELALETSRHF